jgi:hypothetical protein
MNACRLLFTHLRKICPTIHVTRLRALVTAVEAAIQHRLTLTDLGRGLKSFALVKHNIKRMDRLLGNGRLSAERIVLYTEIAHWALAQVTEPLVLIDWSTLTPDHQWHVLRASIPVQGRALTIYEEVHPLQSLTNRHVHQAFLHHLRTVLPSHVRPILVTDAGFRGTWFRMVEVMNWNWVGRIRNRTLVQKKAGATWEPCKAFYTQATKTPTTLGLVHLVRSHPLRCSLHLVRQSPKGRIHKSVFGMPIRASSSRKIAVREREPWLIASSVGLQAKTAKRIMAIYRTRMQIEEAFRDLKSERYGLGFSASQTRVPARLAILLLIGALALLVLWLVGQATMQQQWHYRYQSNTRRSRPVLSVISIGRHVVGRAIECLATRHLIAAFAHLQRQLTQVHAT